MNRFNGYTLICVLAFLCFCSSLAQAQVGTPRYTLRNRGDLRELLLKNSRNPRALYDLSILAQRRGWAGTAIQVGDELLEKNKNDPYAQGLIAFCVYTSLFSANWNWPYDASAGDLWKRQSTASYFLRESLQVQDPAMRLMAAISLANLPTADGFDESLRLFQAVLKQQPNWADAHYWYGHALDRTSRRKPSAQRQAATRQVLAHYNRAQQLDPGLRNVLLINRVSILEKLERPKEALSAFDAYIRLYPAYVRNREQQFPGIINRTRARLLKQIREGQP